MRMTLILYVQRVSTQLLTLKSRQHTDTGCELRESHLSSSDSSTDLRIQRLKSDFRLDFYSNPLPVTVTF